MLTFHGNFMSETINNLYNGFKAFSPKDTEILKTRNVGIIAHIDAGKTTTTERILFYTGINSKVGEVHDGASTMDWMEQEKERGITITSAVTHCNWSVPINNKKEDFVINIIDTPGHVDFTIEVERSLRVLDGAVIVLESVSGVQTQTVTVNRQATKYKVPRLIFINKMDRLGADFNNCVKTIREKLNVTPVVIMLPVGAENHFTGVIDLITMKYYKWSGVLGENYQILDIPSEMEAEAKKARSTLLEDISSEDDDLMMKFIAEGNLEEEEIHYLLRVGTIKNKFIPILCGSSYKNAGVQTLLDAMVRYLPCPKEKQVIATNINKETRVVEADIKSQVCGYVFKVVKDKYAGSLAFVRIYSGEITTGMELFNPRNRRKFRLGRMVIMHSNKREEIKNSQAGDLVAFIGSENLLTGDTFWSTNDEFSLESLDIPERVINLAITPETKGDYDKLSEALHVLASEDPSFAYSIDPESKQIIISGMGELHLEIKVDILFREYKIKVQIGNPKVTYRETITTSGDLTYTHKKQSGGQGQFAVLSIRTKPLERGSGFIFKNSIAGMAIPKEFVPSIKKGIETAAQNGPIMHSQVIDFEVELYDGATHEVDSTTLAFELASRAAFAEMLKKVEVKLLEPVMLVTVTTPTEFFGPVSGDLNSKRGRIVEVEEDQTYQKIVCHVPLSEMFGYINILREKTQGKANYNMELAHYALVPEHVVEQLKKNLSK